MKINFPALFTGLQRAVFGAEVFRANGTPMTAEQLLSSMDRGNTWFPVVREPFTGAWQRNISLTQPDSLLTFYAVYACLERIASDVGKCRLRLVEENAIGIWNEVEVAAFSPVIRKPNHYQNRIQFYENWVLSKLMQGNTYVLKERDNRNVVIGMHILDPWRVRVYQTPLGDVYYELGSNGNMGPSEIDSEEAIRRMIPQSEIIHDMCTVKFHPLCGVSPLVCAAMAAGQGMSIQNSSTQFFTNRALPGGILTAPGEIKEATARRLKEYWQNEFMGNNLGKIAVLGDGLKFEPMMVSAQESQVTEQLGLTAQMVCSAFGVPAYMVGVGSPPSYNNIEALNQQYYSQTLQKFFEAIELGLDEGLGLTEVTDHVYGTWFDLDDLLRMDTQTLVETEAKSIGGGFKSPDEARKRLNLGPVAGGNTPYLQQQNFSLAALAKRDAKADPFAKGGGTSGGGAPFGGDGGDEAPPPPPPKTDDDEAEDKMIATAAIMQIASWELKSELARLNGTS
jgi:HK97 family phage portal protein